MPRNTAQPSSLTISAQSTANTVTASDFLASSPVQTGVIVSSTMPVNGSSATSTSLAPAATVLQLARQLEELEVRHPLLPSILGLDNDEPDVDRHPARQEVGEDEDACEWEDDEDVQGDRFQHLYLRGGDQIYSSAFTSIHAQLEEIRTLLQELVLSAPKAKTRRQVADVHDQEQSYGDRGKDLTQDQKASLEALVKGVNGYQGSIDGATNTGQSAKEIWQQYPYLVELLPLLTSATPDQVAEALNLIKMLEEQQRDAKPSSTALGSQAGQSASEASWAIPGESAVHGAGYLTYANGAMLREAAETFADAQNKAALQAKLQALQKQENDLAIQLRKKTLSGHDTLSDRRYDSQPAQGSHSRIKEEVDLINSMVFKELLESNRTMTTTATTTTAAAMTITSDMMYLNHLPSTSRAAHLATQTFPTPAVQRRALPHDFRPVSHTTERIEGKEEEESRKSSILRLLTLGGFDVSKLAAALSNISASSSSLPPTAKPDDEMTLSALLEGLDSVQD
ncbi:hypothetical protein CBS101457_001612 [Exobasidium rhododendri]|nr:hypothetical protein CBS101457_001612 [Exobasidium rhododendri]